MEKNMSALIRGYDNRYALSELWGQAFGDESDFISKMYDCGYLKPSDIFAVTQDGRPIAALFLPEYQICLGGVSYPIRLLSCVATDPMHQGKGWMSRLIPRALELVRSECCGVCVIPVSESLFSFYEKFGFQSAFSLSENIYTPEMMEGEEVLIPEPASLDVLYETYQEKYRIDGCVFKTKDRFFQAVEEYNHPSQPTEFVVFGSDFAFVRKETSRVVALEWSGEEKTLAKVLLKKYGLPVCIQGFPTDEKQKPLAMVYPFTEPLISLENKEKLYLNCMYN